MSSHHDTNLITGEMKIHLYDLFSYMFITRDASATEQLSSHFNLASALSGGSAFTSSSAPSSMRKPKLVLIDELYKGNPSDSSFNRDYSKVTNFLQETLGCQVCTYGSNDLESTLEELKVPRDNVFIISSNTRSSEEQVELFSLAYDISDGELSAVFLFIQKLIRMGFQNKNFFEYFFDKKDFVLLAVSKDGYALEYASEGLRAYRNVVLAAVRTQLGS